MSLSLAYALDRLYATGWMPVAAMACDRLPDGRRYPTVAAVQSVFAAAGLKLSIKHHIMFDCFRARWSLVGEVREETETTDERHGAVVGSCEQEAAVYALATLRASQQVSLAELV